MNKKHNLVYLAALTLCVALVWASVSAVSHFRKPTITKDTEKAAAGLDPNLDLAFFTKLQQKSASK